MNAKDLLNQILQSGQELAQRGMQLAEKGLDIPGSGPARGEALGNLAKGAAAGGLMALLLGTRAGRGLAGPLMKIGGIAAIGAVAYSAWKKWQAGQKTGVADFGQSISGLSGPEAESRATILVRAMIAAAGSDGHLDERERSLITDRIASLELPDTERRLLQSGMEQNLDVRTIASLADSPGTASEIYLTSLLVVDSENEQERQYLNDLAEALQLPWDLVRQLEAEAAAD